LSTRGKGKGKIQSQPLRFGESGGGPRTAGSQVCVLRRETRNLTVFYPKRNKRGLMENLKLYRVRRGSTREEKKSGHTWTQKASKKKNEEESLCYRKKKVGGHSLNLGWGPY